MVASCATYIVGGFDLIALIDDGSTIGIGTVVGGIGVCMEKLTHSSSSCSKVSISMYWKANHAKNEHKILFAVQSTYFVAIALIKLSDRPFYRRRFTNSKFRMALFVIASS